MALLLAAVGCGGGDCKVQTLFRTWHLTSFTALRSDGVGISPLALGAGNYGSSNQITVGNSTGSCTFNLDLERARITASQENGTYSFTSPFPDSAFCRAQAVPGTYEVACNVLTVSNAFGVAVYE